MPVKREWHIHDKSFNAEPAATAGGGAVAAGSALNESGCLTLVNDSSAAY